MLLASTKSVAAAAPAGRKIAATAQFPVRRCEPYMACMVLFTFLLPILTFQPALDMNGMNRAANQLARKSVSGQEHALLLRSSALTPGELFSARGTANAGALPTASDETRTSKKN